MQEQLAHLRSQIQAVQKELKTVEEDLERHHADIKMMDAHLDGYLGPSFRKIAALDSEMEKIRAQIRRIQGRSIYGESYASIEDQFRETWLPAEPARIRPAPNSEPDGGMNIKRLYRRLARRYHPDLSSSPIDKAFRTERMTALNTAYSAGSLVELQAMWDEPEEVGADRPETDAQLRSTLESELHRSRQRLAQVKNELEQLHHHPTIELTLEIKLARRDGRNLLAEMLVNLENKIDQKTAERIQLQAQLARLQDK